jgi:hypothetical protein
MIPIPTKYACWAELVVAQILMPNVSFLGHLSGILAGLLFLEGSRRGVTHSVERILRSLGDLLTGGGGGGAVRREVYIEQPPVYHPPAVVAPPDVHPVPLR